MILRNIALRQSRRTFYPPIRTCLRSLTTETLIPENEVVQRNIPYDTSRINSNIINDGTQLHLSEKIAKPQRKKKKKELHPLKKDFVARQHLHKSTRDIGSKVEPYYQPHEMILNPPKPEDVTLELLMASQAHMGHATSIWNPMNQRYIYGVRQGIHIISLETTAQHLRRAAKIVEAVAYHGGLVLFVGTRDGHQDCVVKAAEIAKGYHVFDRWLPGTITNKDLSLRVCPKTVVGTLDEHIYGYEDKLKTWPALKPDLVVVLNPLENYPLLYECGSHNIPTIGVIDTDADPTWVTYPIPANDDSIRCIEVIAGVLGRAGEAGQERRLEDAKNGKCTWQPPEGLGEPYDGDKDKQKMEHELRTKRTASDNDTLALAKIEEMKAQEWAMLGLPLEEMDEGLLDEGDSEGDDWEEGPLGEVKYR